MKDLYVELIEREREKAKASVESLCDGIYTKAMYYRVRNRERVMDKITAKRLLARLGVDNTGYEHYLEYEDYNVWLDRMKIINAIEDGKIDIAEELLEAYKMYNYDSRQKSRANLQKQFYLFMKIQILRRRIGYDDECYGDMCEEALRLTVPNIDQRPLSDLFLSPVELNLALEYKVRKYKKRNVKEILDIYEEFIAYIDNGLYSKVSAIKLYSKIVVYMYNEVQSIMDKRDKNMIIEIYRRIYIYSDRAVMRVKDRKFLYYYTELLEIRSQLIHWFMDNNIDISDIKGEEITIEELENQIHELKRLYDEHNISAYMEDECYFYRESSLYCVNEIVKARREMMNITQEELGGDDIATTTIWRLENIHKSVNKETLHSVFERLNLFPGQVNTGVVTSSKEAVELYEEIRYADYEYKDGYIKGLITKLKEMLPNHPINKQVIMRLEGNNQLRLKEKTHKEHIETLKQALECTVRLVDIQKAKKIFLSSEEMTTLYLISVNHKRIKEYDKALFYIKELLGWCKDVENENLVDGRAGMYELIMTYVASLYGDIGRYAESNDISDKLIKLCLKLRRGNDVHGHIYCITWNNDEANISTDEEYNAKLYQCISLSRLLGDKHNEKFYRKHLRL